MQCIKCGLDSSSSGQGTIKRFREYDKEQKGSIKGEEFTDQLSDYHILTNGSNPWR
jgi:Ca2+-binding EF-hand superfamily protein